MAGMSHRVEVGEVEGERFEDAPAGLLAQGVDGGAGLVLGPSGYDDVLPAVAAEACGGSESESGGSASDDGSVVAEGHGLAFLRDADVMPRLFSAAVPAT